MAARDLRGGLGDRPDRGEDTGFSLKPEPNLPLDSIQPRTRKGLTCLLRLDWDSFSSGQRASPEPEIVLALDPRPTHPVK